MRFDNILIVSDIDGTFTDSESRLVKRNLEMVEYLKSEGGLFTIATGRIPSIMGKLTGIVDDLVNAPVICCNGAFAYDFQAKRTFNEIFLNCEKATEFARRVERDFPEVAIRLFTREGKRVVHESPSLLLQAGDNTPIDLAKIPRENWYRVSFDSDPQTIAKLRAEVEPDFAEYFDFVTASPEIYEFNDKSATKGTALDKLRELLISQGRADESLKIYAVGDFLNDLDMLRHCDVPCCPANAIDEVKSVAKLHLCRCDDGAIADLIERL